MYTFSMEGEKRMKSIQDDGPPGFREHAAERLVRFLNQTELEVLGNKKIEEIFVDEESIKSFLNSLELETYKQLLIGLNAFVRNKDTKEVWEMDGENVRMGEDDIFPAQSEKDRLLGLALEAVQMMIRNKRPMEDIALLIGVAITAIHPFVDGNGRTAKCILVLLMQGYNPAVLQEVLKSEGFSNAVNASEFQDVALNILEEDFRPTSTYSTFEEYVGTKEYNARVVEVIIDIIKNNNDERYKGWFNEDVDMSFLQTYKESRIQYMDKDLYRKVFTG